MKKQAGFTLIELIMVIVILGVLAAFALPRFADLGGEARLSTIQGALGAVKSAANISHAKSLAAGNPATITLEGETIDMVNGYPASVPPTNEGIAKAAGVDVDFDVDTSTAGQVTISASGASGTCEFVYTDAPANGSPTYTLNASAAACN